MSSRQNGDYTHLGYAMVPETLKEVGFSRVAMLSWDDAQRFKFRFTDSDLRDFVYVYVDAGMHRVLNVGHTGERLRGRLRSYKAWLNGCGRRKTIG